MLRGRDRARADEHGAALRVHRGDPLDHAPPFLLAADRDARRFDAPPLLDVRSDARDVEAVDVTHLAADLVHGARHSREHEIAPEETLIADAADRLHLAGDLAVFLDLDELVEALLPGPTVEHASRELVDDLHLAFVDEIMLIALEEMQ